MELSQSTESIDSRLRINLVSLAVKYPITYIQYITVAKWLDCHRWIDLKDREFNSELVKVLLEYHIYKRGNKREASDFYAIWNRSELIFSTVDYNEQAEIAKKVTQWIND